ncbi:hypothetical protein EJ06DRAFT_526040 [Trichodelitschia bisporula]|uniref:INSIG domain protein n=1 Tax=Trichodelitschia bisporula TaxID=703511 RepID=A0A6G1IB71_9PEZI|nr:hypothetical protein EJ06DRAFT_526040 [Trichodelitschia bisporula]
MESDATSPPLLRPRPRRPFELPTASPIPSSTPDASSPPTPYLSTSDLDKSDVSRSRSILNLTASTLYGIYSPTAFDGTSGPTTPWGAGAETPSRNASVGDFSFSPRGSAAAELEARLLQTDGDEILPEPRSKADIPSQPHTAPRSRTTVVLYRIWKAFALFVSGVCYGALIAHLRDDRTLRGLLDEGLGGAEATYLLFWGAAGVAIGSVLPWIDKLCDGGSTEKRHQETPGVEWHDVVRSVGAFIGIAFAIRKLPWSSTLQLSLTLALANPFLWYLLDGTFAGFALSSLMSTVATLVVLGTDPAIIPAPAAWHFTSGVPGVTVNATDSASISAPAAGPWWSRFSTRPLHGYSGAVGANYEGVGVATWIASVLFCSCVCFGSIGRLLVKQYR